MSLANKGGGPCGACKFLRRKCVKGCIFAPYFDPDQGTVHFAAVHKVFGASNASKLLQGVPAHKRVDAGFSLCYEALARVKDPVYGCAGQIFTLQQQVVNLQAEVAYTQARVSTLQRLTQMPPPKVECQSPTNVHYSSEIGPDMVRSSNMSIIFDPAQLHQPSIELASSLNPFEQGIDDEELQSLVRDCVSRYLPGIRFQPSTSN
ncbi:LOB domain-containing protein 18 [Hibiscus syriacus]|uniref:LOB domain-containing protein 18 n=1 Tax=Hibiscus syriacus TaxID=106335 RepID=A0A6A3C8E4_HIBSY|nr:LOB domain-containing protein 19-like [Hibiscus syriacus]KAE8723319.1 LOB domain-containing protein 18 [Hibiscus syriacus]